MKRIFLRNYAWLLICVISTAGILIYTSCKKHETPGAGDYSSLLQSAQGWYENDVIQNEIKNSKDTLPLQKGAIRKPGLMKQINGLLKWNEAKEYNEQGIRFLVTPLDEDIKPFANKEYEAARCLIFYKDAASNMQMHVMEMVGEKGKTINGSVQEVARAAFSNYNNAKGFSLGAVNASVLFYDRGYKYEKGCVVSPNPSANKLMRLRYEKYVSKRPFLSTTGQRTTEEDWCTTYYLVGYHYDPITGQIVDAAIISTRVECPDSESPPPYGDSGGNASPAPPDAECVINAANTLNEMSNSATVVNNTVSIITETEGAQTRTKKYQWVILQGIGWSISSFETGVHIKTRIPNPAMAWVWQSLTNNGISFSGGAVGGHIEPKLIRAIPTVGKYNAIMDLTFNVEYSVACKGSPFTKGKDYNAAKNFSVYD